MVYEIVIALFFDEQDSVIKVKSIIKTRSEVFNFKCSVSLTPRQRTISKGNINKPKSLFSHKCSFRQNVCL
jgi:hypothetical protein